MDFQSHFGVVLGAFWHHYSIRVCINFWILFRMTHLVIFERRWSRKGSQSLHPPKEFSSICLPGDLPERSWNTSASPARFIIDFASILLPNSYIMHTIRYHHRCKINKTSSWRRGRLSGVILRISSHAPLAGGIYIYIYIYI